MKNNKKSKFILSALLITLNVFIVSAINTSIGYADRASDYCDETILVTNTDTAARNAECKASARAAETQCGETNGVGNQAWQQCIDNYYEGVTGNSPSGSTNTTPSTDQNGGTSRDNLSGGQCEPEEGEELNSENCGIIRIVVDVTNFLSAIAGIALVASLMISGYLYMTARDNAGQIEKAKARIVQTLIALIVFIFMYALLNFLIPGGLGLS
jgi:hypothetical protein